MAAQRVALITAEGCGMGAATTTRMADDGCRISVPSPCGKGDALARSPGGAVILKA
jgi:NAD(P)-dependent dehydrogenase (short-subunit alcohol dehydrogenase family)